MAGLVRKNIHASVIQYNTIFVDSYPVFGKTDREAPRTLPLFRRFFGYSAAPKGFSWPASAAAAGERVSRVALLDRLKPSADTA